MESSAKASRDLGELKTKHDKLREFVSGSLNPKLRSQKADLDKKQAEIESLTLKNIELSEFA